MSGTEPGGGRAAGLAGLAPPAPAVGDGEGGAAVLGVRALAREDVHALRQPRRLEQAPLRGGAWAAGTLHCIIVNRKIYSLVASYITTYIKISVFVSF